MKYPKFWIYIIAAIVAAMIVACLCSCNNMKRPDNGHDYDLEPMQSTAMRHSPNCRKCKEIRKQEIIEVVDSMIRDQKVNPRTKI
jgi:hypothetical protein